MVGSVRNISIGMAGGILLGLSMIFMEAAFGLLL
ncbi:hypothetical protein DFP90_10946 [Aestuariispira insulae]|uniref:Uncharacterized protein n=1 Tax=Aestuariispira insulae TaxID=1461337 RepID=A0A3D9HDY7_9PROT|nr:hypothetical protein DFP90_10946 [Aestuariispira insulae]